MRASRSKPAHGSSLPSRPASFEVLFVLLASIFDRMSSEFSGVRSSCDMLARNSLLYFEVSASWRAFQLPFRRLDFAVLLLDFLVLRSAKLSKSGVVAPRSQRETVIGSTSTCAARCFCFQPLAACADLIPHSELGLLRLHAENDIRPLFSL